MVDINFNKYFSSNYIIIFLVMFSTGLASLIYEVVLISLVATIIGVTETSTSIVLGSFLLGLAFGALIGGFLSKKKINHLKYLIIIEILIALFGFSFLSVVTKLNLIEISSGFLFWIIVFMLLLPTTLMGLEIPLAVRILESKKRHATGFVYFSDTLGGVIGALFAGIVFIPILGFKGAMFFGGILNLTTAILATRVNKKFNWKFISLTLIFFIAVVAILFSSTDHLYNSRLNFLNLLYSKEDSFYTETIFSVISPYQHIIIGKSPYYGNQLYINGKLQISEFDSLKYHEYLVLPAIAAHQNPEKILIIGGGDGGALFQILKYNFSVIDHVDLDKEVIETSRKYLQNVHHGALDDKRVTRHIMDGRKFLRESKINSYDIIIIDLPDPYKLELSPLYSREFYQLVKRALKSDGVVVTQAISPYYYLEAFSSLQKTIKSVFPNVQPYVVPISSFSSTGYFISSQKDPRIVRNPNKIKGKWYTTEEDIFDMPVFLKDFLKKNIFPINTDENPIIHIFMQSKYYAKGVSD